MSLPVNDPFDNAASDPDAVARRTGGSANDPHGGQEAAPGRPDPDPIAELATIDDRSQDNDPDRPHLARQLGPQPGFGPDEMSSPEFDGDPELGIDPRDAAAQTGRGR